MINKGSSTFRSINNTHRKLCFVTIGATASFHRLLLASLTNSFLTTLASFHYTDLVLQYGLDGDGVLAQFCPADEEGLRSKCGIRIEGFGFRSEGLAREMRAAKGAGAGFNVEGCVVSHAG